MSDHHVGAMGPMWCGMLMSPTFVSANEKRCCDTWPRAEAGREMAGIRIIRPNPVVLYPSNYDEPCASPQTELSYGASEHWGFSPWGGAADFLVESSSTVRGFLGLSTEV